MHDGYREILNPVGDTRGLNTIRGTARSRGRGRPVIGLLNNSKPNVDFFLKALEREICREHGQYDVLNVMKSRSAAPCAELDRLAQDCDYVINAVAD